MAETALTGNPSGGPSDRKPPIPIVCITPVDEEPFTYIPDDEQLIDEHNPGQDETGYDGIDDDGVCQSLDDQCDSFPSDILHKTAAIPGDTTHNHTHPRSSGDRVITPARDPLGKTQSLGLSTVNSTENKATNVELRVRRSKQGERFLRSIKRHNLPEVKSLQADSELRLHAYANQYGESAIESAVQSSSVALLDCIILNTQLEERPKVLQRCMLFAVRDDKAVILEHLLDLYKETRRLWQRQGIESVASNVRNSESNNVNVSDNEEETNNDEPKISYFGPGNSPTAKISSAGMTDRCNKPMDGWTLKRKRNKVSSILEDDDEIDDPAYSDHMTPLVLAAQLGRFKLIKLLMDKVSPDIHPISHGCTREKCMICQRSSFNGHRSIQDCRRSIEVFKALSSPAYLFIACHRDPILEAFHISEACLRRKQQDVAFSSTYDEVLSTCHQFGTDMLAMCRTSAEVLILLNHKDGVEACNAKGGRIRFPRIQLAIHYSQKSFVAHPHCQQVLMDAWARGLPSWVIHNQGGNLRVLLYTLLLTLFFPVTFTVYMFPLFQCLPVERIERYVKEPVGKYLHDTVSYVIFLILLTLCTIYRSDTTRELGFTGLEWMVLLWVCGLTVRFLKMAFYRRSHICNSRDFLNINTNWQIGDFLSMLSFWIFYLLRIACWASNATQDISHDANNETSHEVFEDDDQTTGRVSWKATDPYLISEIFFATGCIFAVLHIFTLLKTNRKLGPLQVSLKEMVNVFVRFFVLFAIVMAAFSLGLTYLYSGYNKVMYQGENVNIYMVTLSSTLKTLFWSLFGYGEADHADLVIENQGHRPTELVGYFMFGLYHVITVIFLANMLIAMVTNFYNDVEKNADEEWKFTMTQLRMSYFNEIGCLPPPLNFFPIRWLMKKLMKLCGRNRQKYKTERYMNRDGQYMKLIGKLQKRYWLNERIGSSQAEPSCNKDSKLFFEIVGDESA